MRKERWNEPYKKEKQECIKEDVTGINKKIIAQYVAASGGCLFKQRLANDTRSLVGRSVHEWAIQYVGRTQYLVLVVSVVVLVVEADLGQHRRRVFFFLWRPKRWRGSGARRWGIHEGAVSA